ncbi:alanine racemase [Intestinimonas sp.]|uniref:alanine racemase n=1 Tax=Intestinimonas sp. TaxID=1965293 RepID=UPI00260D4323|nr:alanine racemase [Intestinimonas sp.]
MEGAQKRTWAEVDLGRLARNYHALRDLTEPDCKFLGVVKANAYGHGAVPVARKLEELGADYLAVACLDEAVELRTAGIGLPLLILGVTPVEYADVLMEYEITQTVGDLETAQALSAAGTAAGQRVRVHLKVDTGMSRLGFLWSQGAEEDIRRVYALPGLDCEGIFTHFADADGDEAYTMAQFTRFLDLLDALKEEGVTFPIRHCAASAAVLNYPCTHLDMIRPGIALYGHYPAPGMEHTCPLEPVMTLKTRVAAVRTLPAGTPVSYGCTHVLGRDSRLAVLPVGYADGYFRLFSDQLAVEVRGGKAPLVGRVCMDMCMADVTDLMEVQPGDETTLYGNNVPVEVGAALAGTIPYELLCDVSPRVPRLYRES